MSVSRLLLFALAVGCAAQDSIYLASISGRVTDPSGAIVQRAAVTVRQIGTNFSTDGASDNEGRFRFPFLRLGAYEVQVSAPGFQKSVRTITVNVGSAVEIPVELVITAYDTAGVNVTATLETERTQIAGTVQRAEIDALPLNGRSFLEV